jgi:hypothetical protein
MTDFYRSSMDAEFSVAYLLYILAITLTSLLMIIIGGWIRDRLQKGGLRFRFAQKSNFRKKLTGFFMFIIAIFLLGWMGERLQAAVFDYLVQNIATSIVGFIVVILITWFLYDWLVWRKNN